jgi:hypothetical protein
MPLQAADPHFAARDADHHLVVGKERRERHAVAVRVVLDLSVP